MKVIPLLLLLVACTPAYHPRLPLRYCVHNGYAGFQPICSTFEMNTYGIVLRGCEAGNRHNFDLYNPTNVTDCGELFEGNKSK